MVVVIQRVTDARVTVDGKTISEIGAGLMILAGIATDDTTDDIERVARKTAALRIFNDADGVMNRSVTDVDGQVLVVSQFTLLASTRKGNRPSYINAAGHEKATALYRQFCSLMSSLTGKEVAQGIFGADMKVSLTNDGPVTIVIDSRHWV